MTTLADTKVVPFDGEVAANRAIELAGKAGEDVGKALLVIADAKQDMAGGPLRVMIALRNAFGDELDAMPKPGEKEGNNRDEITVEETVNGETKSRKTTFYTVFADNLSVGKSIVNRIALCQRAAKPDTVKTDIPDDVTEMVQTGTIQRHIDYLTGRRATFRASIKKAMELVFQFSAIEQVPGIQCEPIWIEGKEGEEVMSIAKCIQVWQTPDNDANGKPKPVKYSVDVTVGTFLKYNAAKAIEAGGGFKALEKTLERGTKKASEEGKAPDRRIASLDTMVGVTVELHRFTDELILNRDTAEYNKLIKALKSNNATGEVISSFVELRNYLDDIVKAADLQGRYDKLQMGEFKAA